MKICPEITDEVVSCIHLGVRNWLVVNWDDMGVSLSLRLYSLE